MMISFVAVMPSVKSKSENVFSFCPLDSHSLSCVLYHKVSGSYEEERWENVALTGANEHFEPVAVTIFYPDLTLWALMNLFQCACVYWFL